ncbi:TIGR03118 family protein [Paraburkholderia sp. MMS20-SJTN17]|uniref:TIGR03118 family protein n=1 Tax=Paraburkholderia translucens TaxID=2886945 RepID=A0ABS8KEJ4_9BURK|nr:TIGR03118 family protein [Paraburkholderia sp. MMS20-SJTN17]MCC8402869.1 TIGR03118 family protein [Paraburkholderia sp. MMS20-SJTN17]
MKSLLAGFGAVTSGAAIAILASCGGGGGDSGGGSSNPSPPAVSSFNVTALVSDGAVAAAHADANLKNPWGVVFNPQGFVWVADNGTNVATLYDGNGVPQSLIVTIPPGRNGAASPTGIVFNGTQSFTVKKNGNSGTAAFIFAGEGGTITAWAPTVGPTNAFVMYDDGAGGAVYKGLALAAMNGNNFLYATDFHNNKIDVFDTTFTKVAMPGAFKDPAIPAGFAPFGIRAIGSNLFVTYAMQDAAKHDDVAGAGLGMVDVYDTAGNLKQRFATGAPLNAPWGIAQAPANFGSMSGAILIANFGDGTINALDAASGHSMGPLTGANGATIVEPGVWGIAFGNDLSNQPSNTLFFAAGPNAEADGVYGRIDLNTTTSAGTNPGSGSGSGTSSGGGMGMGM